MATTIALSCCDIFVAILSFSVGKEDLESWQDYAVQPARCPLEQSCCFGCSNTPSKFLAGTKINVADQHEIGLCESHGSVPKLINGVPAWLWRASCRETESASKAIHADDELAYSMQSTNRTTDSSRSSSILHQDGDAY